MRKDICFIVCVSIATMWVCIGTVWVQHVFNDVPHRWPVVCIKAADAHKRSILAAKRVGWQRTRVCHGCTLRANQVTFTLCQCFSTMGTRCCSQMTSNRIRVKTSTYRTVTRGRSLRISLPEAEARMRSRMLMSAVWPVVSPSAATKSARAGLWWDCCGGVCAQQPLVAARYQSSFVTQGTHLSRAPRAAPRATAPRCSGCSGMWVG